MYLIYKLIWYFFAAILDRTMTLKTSISKSVSFELDEIISGPGVHVILQYSLVYFN